MRSICLQKRSSTFANIFAIAVKDLEGELALLRIFPLLTVGRAGNYDLLPVDQRAVRTRQHHSYFEQGLRGLGFDLCRLDPTAILYRLLHHLTTMNIRNESYRRLEFL
jgi:hypothetical protein